MPAITNADRIANILIAREVKPTTAYAAGRILADQEVSAINVNAAYRLGRGISHDLVMEAIEQAELDHKHVQGRARFNEALARSSKALWR